MAKTYGHAWERYYNGTRALMGEDDPKERLKRSLGETTTILQDEIPPEVLPHWQAINKAIDAAVTIDAYVQGLGTDERRALFDQILGDLLVIERKYL